MDILYNETVIEIVIYDQNAFEAHQEQPAVNSQDVVAFDLL